MNRNHTASFDSFSAFLGVLGKPQHASAFYSSASPADRWCPATLGEAQTLATTGWPEGRLRVESALKPLIANLRKSLHTPEVTYDVVGDCWDMGRVTSGEPECAMQWTPSEAQSHGKKLFTINVNAACSSSFRADQLLRRGIAIAALVDALEYSDYRVQVTLSFGIRPTHGATGWKGIIAIRIKNFADALQLDQLAFALAHPAVLRRLYFRYAESSFTEAQWNDVRGSYGAPDDTLMEPADIIIGGVHSGEQHKNALDNPEGWVNEQLVRQGLLEAPASPSEPQSPTPKPTPKPTAPSGKPCKVCGGPTVQRTGKYGTFYGCKAYPRCKGKG